MNLDDNKYLNDEDFVDALKEQMIEMFLEELQEKNLNELIEIVGYDTYKVAYKDNKSYFDEE